MRSPVGSVTADGDALRDGPFGGFTIDHDRLANEKIQTSVPTLGPAPPNITAFFRAGSKTAACVQRGDGPGPESCVQPIFGVGIFDPLPPPQPISNDVAAKIAGTAYLERITEPVEKLIMPMKRNYDNRGFFPD